MGGGGGRGTNKTGAQSVFDLKEHDTAKELRETHFCISSSIAGFNFAACWGE